MMELILLPLAVATGWLIGRIARTATHTAMLALVIAVVLAVATWLPPLQAVLGGAGIAVGFVVANRE